MPGCTSWLRSSTPALLFRLCADRRLRLLSLAFLFGTGGLQGGEHAAKYNALLRLATGGQQVAWAGADFRVA